MTSWPHLSDALPQLATAGEVAEQLHMSPATVARMCKAGTLPAVKVGGRWHVQVAKLAEQLNSAPSPEACLRDLPGSGGHRPGDGRADSAGIKDRSGVPS